MATIDTKIVDPDNGPGTDYTSLSAWEAGEQKDLVTADEIAVAECRCSSSSADTVACEMGGWTTDSTRYVKIWTTPAGGYRHAGKWGSTKYRLVGATTRLFLYSCNYIEVIGLQFDLTAPSSSWLLIVSAANATIDKCIFRYTGVGAGYHGQAITPYQLNTDLKVTNCLIYGFSWGFRNHTTICPNYKYIYIYNCTIINCDYGIRIEEAKRQRAIIKNTIISGGLCFQEYFSGDYNTSSDGTAPGSNSKTFTTPSFLDAPNKDYHLGATDTVAADEGVDLSGDLYCPVSDDIDGDSRPYNILWDIGADERGESPVPPPVPLQESIIVPNWEPGISIKRAWKTTIQRSITGKEKRSALLTYSRKSIRYRSSALTSKEINWLKRNLYLNSTEIWNMPFWVDWVLLTVEATIGANSLTVDDTRYRAFQNEKDIILFEDYLSFEIIEMASFTQTTMALNDTLESTWPIGTKVYPIITTRLKEKQNIVQMFTNRIGMANISVTEVLE